MTSSEFSSFGSQERIPAIGTIKHLEYISLLDIPSSSELWDPRAFLAETNIATTFAKFIRRHRTSRYRLLHMNHETHMTLDSQMEEAATDWPQEFSATVNVYPTLIYPRFASFNESEAFNQRVDEGKISMDPHLWPPDVAVERYSKSLLRITGRPFPGDTDQDVYRYGLYIPLDDRLIFDSAPDRVVEARYDYAHGGHSIYDSSVSETRDNELTFHAAIKEAASDLLSLFHHVYGESQGMPALKHADYTHVKWHPDFLSDDRDEFMPPAVMAPKKYYLDDDPDEFRKKPREQW